MSLKSKQMIELLQLMNDKKKLKRPPRLPDPIRERSSLDNSHEKDLVFFNELFFLQAWELHWWV